MQKYQLYSFPGGGVEEGESFEDALRREVIEETGCDCEIMMELGYIYESRGMQDSLQQKFLQARDLAAYEEMKSLIFT